MNDNAHGIPLADDESAARPAASVRVNLMLPVEVDRMLEARSSKERRSKSAHVAWLIERDVERATQAVPA